MYVLPIYLVGLASYWIFKKIKMPSPVILGSLLGVTIFNILFGPFYLPAWYTPVFTSAVGVSLGLSFGRISKKYALPTVLTVVWSLFMGWVCSLALAACGVDHITAYFACMPGGIMELSINAINYGANVFIVTLFQSIRAFFVLLIFSLVINGKRAEKQPVAPSSLPVEQKSNKPAHSREAKNAGIFLKECLKRYKALFIIYCLAVAANLIGKHYHIPGSNILGPLLVGMIYRLTTNREIYIPKRLNFGARIGAGCLIGLTVTMESLLAVRDVWWVLFVTVGLTILSGFLLAFILEKAFHWQRNVSLLSAAPGGFMPMLILAQEMKVDIVPVAMLQTARLISIVSLAPVLAHYLF